MREFLSWPIGDNKVVEVREEYFERYSFLVTPDAKKYIPDTFNVKLNSLKKEMAERGYDFLYVKQTGWAGKSVVDGFHPIDCDVYVVGFAKHGEYTIAEPGSA